MHLDRELKISHSLCYKIMELIDKSNYDGMRKIDWKVYIHIFPEAKFLTRQEE